MEDSDIVIERTAKLLGYKVIAPSGFDKTKDYKGYGFVNDHVEAPGGTCILEVNGKYSRKLNDKGVVKHMRDNWGVKFTLDNE